MALALWAHEGVAATRNGKIVSTTDSFLIDRIGTELDNPARTGIGGRSVAGRRVKTFISVPIIVADMIWNWILLPQEHLQL
jgi:hypothetical protein